MKPMRLHHVGIVLPTLEKAHQFMQNNGLEIELCRLRRRLPGRPHLYQIR